MQSAYHFGQITPFIPHFLGGAGIALLLAFLAFVGGMAIGLAGATVRSFGPVWARHLVDAYVTFFTNTPQLVQIYFLFFALPEVGVLLEPFEAVLIGMTVNAGAYLTEIQHAGFVSVRQSELEAADTLGFSIAQKVRHVIVPHVVRVLFPPLGSHYIIMTLGTSMAAVFGVEELTGRAFNVNSQTFRSIEVFTIVAVIYVAMTVFASAVLVAAGRFGFRIRMRFF